MSPWWSVGLGRNLRVLLVPSAFYPHTGGIEEITRQLARELLRRGHHPMILTNHWPSDAARSEVMDGVNVRRVSLSLPAQRVAAVARFAAVAPRSAGTLLRVVSAFGPHVLHVHGAGPNAAYVGALRRLIRAPIVFSAHGELRNDAHADLQRSRTLRWGLKAMLRHAAVVTAPSRAVLEEIGEELEVVAPTMVLPNAVDVSEFDLPRAPGDPRGDYIFFAGRLVHQKGVDLLLRAYAQVRTSLAGRRLVVAGDGPERANLERLRTELGLVDEVSFVGSIGRARLAELMAGADAFAFPSRQEAFGIALLEAMAAGTPAVAACVGGIPEFARDGENALLVRPDDAGQLAAALVRLVADSGLRSRLIRGGRAQAAEYSWSRVAPLYETIYLRVAHV